MRLNAEMGPVPCLGNGDHRPPADASILETELCGGCGHHFLKTKHEPCEAEPVLLALLKHFSETDDSKMYRIAKQELNDLRGEHYCDHCRFSAIPISSRVC